MEALILSCSTGGGHNMAAQAVAEELTDRGHNVTFFDPYELVSDRLSHTVANTYIRLVQKAPWLFGIVYALGSAYEHLPGYSPVYWANGKMMHYLGQYLEKHSFDVIVTSHLFPAEILTYMKNHGMAVPKTVFIATDYTCIPFTPEIDCDYYVIPSPELKEEFCRKGIPAEKILPFGIPVRKAFQSQESQSEARQHLHLSKDKRYFLLSGGSIGAGKMVKAIRILERYLKTHEDTVLIVLCGNHETLYKKLSAQYAGHTQICILESTSDMASYLKACDLFLTKPGGLSSTEGAVSGTAMIHLSPIPGCETKNARFFAAHKLCLSVRHMRGQLLPAVQCLQKEARVSLMKKRQKQTIDGRAGAKLCDFLEKTGQ